MSGTISAPVLIVGATGKVGRGVVSAALAAGRDRRLGVVAVVDDRVRFAGHVLPLEVLEAAHAHDLVLAVDGEAELAAEVTNYWAAPSTGAEAPSPHSTGGAVDLTLRWRGGDPLWMGSLFDDASPLAHTARFEAETDEAAFSFSNEEARANRRLLYWLMVENGFASNPSEWWHFSFGDQMWAKLRNEPEALYAGAEAS